MKTKLFFALLISTFLFGCQKDLETRNSVAEPDFKQTRAPEKRIIDHTVSCSENYAIGNEYTLRVTVELNQAGEQVTDFSRYVMYWRESVNDEWKKHENDYNNTSYPLQFWFHEDGPVAKHYWDYLRPGGSGPIERCLQFYLHFDSNNIFPNTFPYNEFVAGYYYTTEGNVMSFEGCATCD